MLPTIQANTSILLKRKVSFRGAQPPALGHKALSIARTGAHLPVLSGTWALPRTVLDELLVCVHVCVCVQYLPASSLLQPLQDRGLLSPGTQLGLS